MSEERKLNLYEKLVEIRKTVPYLQKSTEGHLYKYVSGVDVLAPIVTKMNELGVLLVPEIIEYKITLESEKKRIVEAKMIMKWINTEKPEEILNIPWLLFGEQNDISKAFGSGLTYSERYFLLKFFNIATDKDDPDRFQEKQEQGEKKQELKEKKDKIKEVCTEIQDELVKSEYAFDQSAKKKLLQFAFNSHDWKLISQVLPSDNQGTKYNMLCQGLQTIKNILSNETNIKRLKGEEQGVIFDPTAEPIAPPEGEPIQDEGAKDWVNNLTEIQRLKKGMPEPDYYAILGDTIKGNYFKHANQIKKIVQQGAIIKRLQERVDYYIKHTEKE